MRLAGVRYNRAALVAHTTSARRVYRTPVAPATAVSLRFSSVRATYPTGKKKPATGAGMVILLGKMVHA